MKHVYDWLEEPPSDEGEKDAKEWLEKFCLPAYEKYTKGINKWLDKQKLTCEWEGRRIQCSGASRMGDVWLREENSNNFYDHRVSIEDLSSWNLEENPFEGVPAGNAQREVPAPSIQSSEQ